MFTGKTISVSYAGENYTLYNQRCRQWTHPYPWEGRGNLADSGCGVFSVIHAASFLGGRPDTPEELADFSCSCGGRGDDGTDRPTLLSGMQRAGLAEKYGFAYHFDGLLNDLPALENHLTLGGAALCNLRPGHIVALIKGRVMDGEAQALAVDSYSESADGRVLPAVRECVPGSEIFSPILNKKGVPCGVLQSFALYWVSLSTVRDFNLLYRIRA